ncbi:MAG: glycosyltransferase family 2 protein [Elusimicrobia bacterium]|nr:glycosyltransferase family 2 protein [Elusimicrobiota bacterium]
MKLSVCVIAKDEERDLPGLLESLEPLRTALGPEFEAVVLDSGSSDGTMRAAAGWGARVSSRPFDDFAAQKQACVDRASGDWVLSLDADERLSPEGSALVLQALSQDPPEAGFSLPFDVEFMGRVLRWGGLGGERHLRLFRRAKGRFGGEHLHEGVSVAGPVGRLEARVLHRPYRDLGEYLAKMEEYTARAARRRWKAGRRPCWTDHLRPFWELFVRLVLKGGVLDGRPGVSWAMLSAFHTWLKYARLSEMARAEER